ncbi:MAG: tryptophan--tRNA ligase [Abditibacteriota bacterium]|nr:tryptophan--tRNA ligase [Abditibacteriota bacterium]
MSSHKKRMLSGMQPTGIPHIGNLEGAISNWVKYQDEYDSYLFIADWHSLTTLYANTERIADYREEVALDVLAAGLDPDKCAFFVQSDVKEHAELHLLLSMITPISWLERVPTFKEKKDNVLGGEQASYGLMGYPVLMSADILIYKADVVPVGRDQLPHLELCREIGRRFNVHYGDVFPECAGLMTSIPAMPGLDGRKMSKSYDNAIYVSDDADTTWQKVRSMFTDPVKIRKDDPGHPDGCAVCAMLNIYRPDNDAQLRNECAAGHMGCMQCKKQLAEILNERLRPIRERRSELADNMDYVRKALADGAEKASATAAETMKEVRSAMNMKD